MLLIKRTRISGIIIIFLTFSSYTDWGWAKFLSQETLKGPSAAELLLHDTLTIMCEIILKGYKKTLVSGYKNLSGATSKISKPAEKWTRNFELAFSNKDFSVVAIVCGDHVFDCHRIILTSQSSVFRAMFSTTWRRPGVRGLRSKG